MAVGKSSLASLLAKAHTMLMKPCWSQSFLPLVVQSLSCVQLFATPAPRTAARQASLSLAYLPELA